MENIAITNSGFTDFNKYNWMWTKMRLKTKDKVDHKNNRSTGCSTENHHFLENEQQTSKNDHILQRPILKNTEKYTETENVSIFD